MFKFIRVANMRLQELRLTRRGIEEMVISGLPTDMEKTTYIATISLVII